MTIPSVKVSQRYQISVPKEARKQLKINKGDRLLVDVQDGIILLIPQPHHYTGHLKGLHSEIWQGIDAQKYIQEERVTGNDL